MNEDELKNGEGAAGDKPLPKPDYDADPNVKARRRAGKRSANQKMGKDLEEGISSAPAAPAEVPTEEAQTEAPEGEGIVGEAKHEEEVVMESAEEKAEETNPESPEAEAAEGEVPAEESPSESESPAEEPMVDSGEYQAPEGPAHDELIDQYHDALAFGDMETAKALYKQLQDHRFRENTHRAKTEAQAEQEVKAYVAAATELAAKHPELAEDGLPASKVMALSDVYRQEGMSAADALRKAVADLYPESPAEAPAPEVAPEPVAEEIPAEPEAPAEEPAAPAEEESVLPDMEERKAAKRSIPAMPSASARNEPAPPPRQPTRSDAIQQMKEKRGQA
jgi:CapZ-interacting protein